MSELIIVTIVTEEKKRKLETRWGTKLLDVLAEYGYSGGFCSGQGSCGGCIVRFLGEAPLPGHSDRAHLEPEQLRTGYRLACMVTLKKSCTIELYLKDDKRLQTVTAGHGISAGGSGKPFIAVDIGTTTVAMQYVDAEKGQILGTHTFLNPQRSYGTDIIARVQADTEGKGALLREPLMEKLRQGIHILEKERQKAFLVLSGNPVMFHLLLGYSAAGLGKEPFLPVSLAMEERSFCQRKAFFLPGISGFVGADITAGMYDCCMEREEELILFLDLGTNAEMVLGNQNRRIAAAAAAGPAFEGGATAGFYGADMIAMTAELLREGMIDRSGLLAEPYFQEGIKREGILITQQHIRQLQMAKAAVRTGLELLMEDYLVTAESVSKVYVAGGFGFYLNTEAAFEIGLLPESFRGKIKAVGNASLSGSIRYGIRQERELIEKLAENTKAVNLARIRGFHEKYIDALSF